jgi:hypothetical protein
VAGQLNPLSSQPSSPAPHRSERDLLEEAVSNTRTLLTRPLQVFAPSREMEAFFSLQKEALVRALEKPQRGLGDMGGIAAAVADELTPKSK